MAQTSRQTSLGRPANPEARAQRREQILAGARLCFLRKGFHAATTAEISTEAGVSVANLYQYFPTKDDLVQALVEEDLAEDLELIRIVDAAGSFRDGLEITTRLAASNRDVEQDSRLRLEILAEASRNPRIAEVVRQADDRMVRALGALVARHQATGELSGDFAPNTAARLILSLYDGMTGRLAFGMDDGEQLFAAGDRMILRALSAVGDSLTSSPKG